MVLLTAAVCSLKPEAGPCRAYKPRYFYNSTSYECERFVYGGCSGNENRFRTKSKCQDTCQSECRLKHLYYTICHHSAIVILHIKFNIVGMYMQVVLAC